MIDLREEFKANKAKVHPLLRNERDKVQKFVNKHLKKGYQTLKIRTDVTGILGRKEGWGEAHGYGLP